MCVKIFFARKTPNRSNWMECYGD